MSEVKWWYVYILECKDGSYYTGITNNLDKRMSQHNDGTGSKYVRSHGVRALIWYTKCLNRSSASKLEYAIKQLTHKQKKELTNERDNS